jgi:hypothetical protein
VSAAMTSFILLTCILSFLVNGKDFVTDKEKSKVLFSKIIIICYSFSVSSVNLTALFNGVIEKGCDQKLLHSCHFLATMILGDNQKIKTDSAAKVCASCGA